MASLREKLALFIMEGEHTVLEWTTFQKQMPNLQLKTVSHGKVLISFNNEEFERPEIWLGNFQSRCIERFETERKKLLIVLPKERQNDILYAGFEEEVSGEIITRFWNYLKEYDYSKAKEIGPSLSAWYVLTDCCGIDRDYADTMLRSFVLGWNKAS